MKLYFFGSEDCETCQVMLAILDKTGIVESRDFDFVFVDAYSEDQQDFCDEHEIDEIPHIKLVGDNNDILFERIGIFHPNLIKELINDNIDDNPNEIDDFEDNVETYYDLRYFRTDKEE